jgi:hypothetical protein
MSGVLFQPPRFTPVNSSGRPYPGAKLYVYRAGTTTLATVYTSSSLTATASNPQTANSAGQFGAVYLNPASGYDYKFVLTTNLGAQLWSEDNVPANPLTANMIGLAINPRTEGEITAAVTPVNYAYPAGNVLRYGANDDPGATDMASAINSCVSANGYAYLPAGTYAIASAIPLTTNEQVYGDGKALTIVKTLANTHDAFTIGTADNVSGVSTTDSRRNVLRDMKITSDAGIGTSNAAIRIDDATSGSRGMVDSHFADLFIGGNTGSGNGFKYGIYGDDLTWNNTFDRLWFEDNERNVRLIGSSNISNQWNGCYFHESDETVQHFYLYHCKQNHFNVCNWGGRAVQEIEESDDVIEFGSGCQGVKFTANNFENYLFGTTGLAVISAGDGCSVSVDSCTFVEIDASSGVTAYFIRANAKSLVTVHNSVTQNEGTTGTLTHFGVEPLGKVEVYDYAPAATSDATHKGLTTYTDIGGVGSIRFHNVPAQQLVSPEYDLDATGSIKDVLLSTTYPIQIGRVALLYTEATSSDAGIQIAVQADTTSDYTADSTISTITSEVSKAAGVKTEGTLTTAKLATGGTVFTSATLNKTGAGKCRVLVDFWYRGGN